MTRFTQRLRRTVFSAAFSAATLITALASPLSTSQALAAEVSVAVAANFTAAAKEIGSAFEQQTGHSVSLSFGSTGKLYTQIVNGAPFEVFLAADAVRPERLVSEGQAESDTLFTYAIGQLALWSADPNLIDADGAVLKQGKLARIAIANPKTAPYGAAAVEALTQLGLWESLEATTVRGDNIAQTYQMAHSGAVPAALVARAQIALDSSGSVWVVPAELYSPIRQKAVLLNKGSDNAAARAFLDYLRSETGRAIVARYGYGLE